MARPEHLFVFCYDISKNGVRARVASLLEGHLNRVQQSVFEGRLSLDDARRLSARVAQQIGVEDSLRVYCVTEAGRRASFRHGAGPPISEAQDFWVL